METNREVLEESFRSLDLSGVIGDIRTIVTLYIKEVNNRRSENNQALFSQEEVIQLIEILRNNIKDHTDEEVRNLILKKTREVFGVELEMCIYLDISQIKENLLKNCYIQG